jgi:hypothetical protein
MERIDSLSWRTSSYSSGNGGECVEVAVGDHVAVRDTKDRQGSLLRFSPAAWRRYPQWPVAPDPRHGVIAIAKGRVPVLMACPGLLVAVLIGVTVPES